MKIIVACDNNNGIGFKNSIPWKKHDIDISYFRRLTCNSSNPFKDNAVLMGYNTWISIGIKPLTWRLNIVLTSKKLQSTDRVKFINNFNDYKLFEELYDTLWVIGGGIVYDQALRFCTDIYITRFNSTHECDVFFPTITGFNIDSEIKHDDCTFMHLTRNNHQEYQYINLVKNILSHGNDKDDRTQIGTLSLFGERMKFDLRHCFPLLTTKKVFFRGVVEELIWFINGNTNANILKDKNIHIWDGNSTREFLDKVGLVDNPEGDLGPVYGFQWRHFGAEYKGCGKEYGGIDQLQNVINTIKTNPNDRRIIMSAWNPSDLHKMALPPCHLMCQFYVNNNELSCMMYQRSCDVGLGVPFNIASYALLTYMIAHVCNLGVGDFIHVLGDTHIYKNHIEALKQQIEKQPYPFPTLKINKQIDDISRFTFDDFTLENYKFHPSIKMNMAV